MGWSRFFRRSRWDVERAEELRNYLDVEIAENIARGMSPDDARRAAHLKLGNPTRIREEIYEMNTLRFVDSLGQDLRYGLRLLRKNPTFSLVAILTLALGTGANAAIFQLVNAVRLRTLPVERPEELVSIRIDTNDQGRTGRFMSRRPFFTEPLWQALRAEQQGLSSLFAWGLTTWNLSTDGEYRPAQGLYVSGTFFGGLGVTPHVGRLLGEADDRPGCGNPGVVLSHGFWRSRYGGDPSVVGRTLTLDGHSIEIVGVTAPQFFGPEVGRTFDAAVPLCAEPMFRGTLSGIGVRDTWFLDIMGRLKAGWTAERAQAQLQSASPGIFASTLPPRYNAETAEQYLAFKFMVSPAATGVSGVRSQYQTQLWVLLATTAIVLLIACANLANLMLARATAREREIAVRLAIGASRRRVVRQLLSESLLIAALGALVGVLLAGWLSQALVAFLSTDSVQLFVDLSPDWRVFTFITALAVIACLLFGLTPALKATGTTPGRAMQAGGRSSTDSTERFALRRALVIVQVALSMVLVVGAMLFAQSLRNLVTLDPGFRTEGIVAVGVDLRATSITPEAIAAAQREIVERVRTVAGVRHADEAYMVPLSGSGWNQTILVEGQRRDGIVNFNRVGADYFRVLDMRLVAGRPFGPEASLGTPDVAIVSDSFARKYFPNQDPLGRTFQIEVGPGQPQPVYHVVGVVNDAKYTEVREEFTPVVYLAATQNRDDFTPFFSVVVRADVPLAGLTPTLTRAVRESAPGATVSYDTIRGYIRDSLVIERVMASLAAFFGGLALLIATIGLYGVIAYTVSRRRIEIGIRMALGAAPGAVVKMIMGESAILVGLGVAGGAFLALVAARWAASLLFGLEPSDPVTFLGSVAALATVSFAAAWLPARRASRVAPTEALRAE